MSQKSEPKDAFEFPFDIEKVFEPNYFSKLPNWQQEIVSFYTRRFEAYSQISEQLAGCRKPQDVFELQTKFYNELCSDYRNEAAVISELLFDMSRPIVEKTSESSEEAHEEKILKASVDAEKIVSLAKEQAETITENAEAMAENLNSGKKKHGKVAQR